MDIIIIILFVLEVHKKEKKTYKHFHKPETGKKTPRANHIGIRLSSRPKTKQFNKRPKSVKIHYSQYCAELCVKTRTCQRTVSVVDDVTLIVMDAGNCDGAV